MDESPIINDLRPKRGHLKIVSKFWLSRLLSDDGVLQGKDVRHFLSAWLNSGVLARSGGGGCKVLLGSDVQCSCGSATLRLRSDRGEDKLLAIRLRYDDNDNKATGV